MSQRQPDRDLRRAVARLRSLPGKDFDAVLATLDGVQRSRVLGLLDDLEGKSATPPDLASSFDKVVLPPDLSPWLVARVNGRGADGDETADRFEMTAHTQQALRRCAAELVPQPEIAPRAISLIGRLTGAFTVRQT